MLSFIAIVTVQVTLEFDMFLRPARRALMASLLSFVIEDMQMNMTDTTLSLVGLVLADFREQTPSTMDIMVVMFVIASIVFAIKSAFFVHSSQAALVQIHSRSSKDKRAKRR
jgi:hypothetical protein